MNWRLCLVVIGFVLICIAAVMYANVSQPHAIRPRKRLTPSDPAYGKRLHSASVTAIAGATIIIVFLIWHIVWISS